MCTSSPEKVSSNSKGEGVTEKDLLAFLVCFPAVSGSPPDILFVFFIPRESFFLSIGHNRRGGLVVVIAKQLCEHGLLWPNQQDPTYVGIYVRCQEDNTNGKIYFPSMQQLFFLTIFDGTIEWNKVEVVVFFFVVFFPQALNAGVWKTGLKRALPLVVTTVSIYTGLRGGVAVGSEPAIVNILNRLRIKQKALI